MPIKLANNASTRLAAPLSSVATSLTVESGGGDKFPVTGSEDYFPMTIVASDGQLEIVKCTARSGDTFTIERAQEGTTAKDFNAGAAIELRLTAGAMTSVIDEAEDRLQGIIDSFEGYSVGDYLTTARNPGENWLRRNGAAYEKSSYPALAPLMPDAEPGVSWSLASSPFAAGVDGYGVAQNPVTGRILVTTSTSTAYYSDNHGDTWTPVTLPAEPSTRSPAVYGNGRWVVAIKGSSPAGAVSVSTDDGATWSAPIKVGLANINAGPTYGNGVFCVGSHWNHRQVDYSSNGGLAWTTSYGPELGGALHNFYADDDGFACYSSTVGIITSPNAASWTTKAYGTGQALYDAARNGSTYIAVGGGGTILKSTDFFSTVQTISSTGSALFSVVNLNGMFVAVGAAGTCRLSFDNGDTWFPSTTGVVGKALNEICLIDGAGYDLLAVGTRGTLIKGEYVGTTRFNVPDDNPVNGWIKAK